MTVRIVQDAEPLPGYRLMERLGRGGYGEVWKAEAPGGLFKAIKFVYGDLEGAGDDNRAAEQELKALNRVKTIRHPYILSIERFDIIEGQLMIVMELADRNLWDRFHECRSQGLPGLPRDELLRYMDESAEALDLMNSHYQIQHLDIKPQNLFLVHNHVKVADFGLAKDFEGIRATVTGGVTPVYAAPETFEGWISRFCDQYSLAIVYQELLTGVRPFAGTNTRQLLMQHLSATPDCSALPPHEREIIARALSKKPDERFPTCTEFVKAIRDSAAAPAKPQPTAPRPEPAADPSRTVPNFRPAKSPDTAPVQPLATPSNPRPAALRGLPALITPGAVASSSSVRPGPASAATPSPVTLQRPIAFETGRVSRLGIAPTEKMGSGILFPVYFVGVGKLGLQSMQRLRSYLHERCGRGSFPHWKWLFIDTDPESVQAATAAPKREALDAGEIYFARMHRPAHYLKREGLPSPDSWMSNELLYRMPREPATGGMRCLGRLALCDHYLNLTQKIRQDLETFMSEDVLLEADRLTQLGIRSNRPRVYLASSLAGGTGAGMLIDLAYIIRNEMRQMGFAKQLVTGLLLSPPVDRSTPKTLPIANACATLAEIHHFSMPSARYEARFDLRQPSIADPERPFERCVLLGLPRLAVPNKPPAGAERAAGLVYQETLTPLGRAMDDARTAYQIKQAASPLSIQSFGCFRFTWPRQRLLDAAAERFAASTLQSWCAKDVAAIRDEVGRWFEEQWLKRQLDPAAIAVTLEGAMTTTLGEPPGALIETEVRTLLGEQGGQIEADDVVSRFEKLLHLVGRPGKDEEHLPGKLTAALESVAKPITKECEIKFAKMGVHFIEQPGYRLAGAEEAIRLCTDRLRGLIDEQERRCRQLAHELDDEFVKLTPLLEAIAEGVHVKQMRKGPSGSEFLNPLRSWAAKRLHLLLCRCVGAVYRQMLGNAPEYLREVNYCRLQLTEAAGQLNKSSESGTHAGSAQDHPILPLGCRNLVEAADRFISQLPPPAIREFEEALQQQVRRHCRALVSVCLAMNESGPRFKEILLEQSRGFIDSRLGQHTPAEEFFRNRPDAQAVQRDILRAYDECMPEPFGPAPRRDGHDLLLGITSDEQGKRLKEIAQELLPDVQLIDAPSANEIVFYREHHDLAITDIPQAGAQAAEAVREMKTKEKINPHARTDVRWDSFLKE